MFLSFLNYSRARGLLETLAGDPSWDYLYILINIYRKSNDVIDKDSEDMENTPLVIF